MIFFATPMYGGQCTAGFHKSAMSLAIELTHQKMPFDWSTPYNESLITRARNKLVSEFMNTEYQALMFIDADIEFTPEDVAALWNMDKPVACAAYPMKRLDTPLSAWKDGKIVDISNDKEPFKVDYAGTGFMMIRREVFEQMKQVYTELKHEEELGECWAFFDTMIHDGAYLSEDYTFCHRWREMGNEIWLDPTIKLSHWGTFKFTGA